MSKIFTENKKIQQKSVDPWYNKNIITIYWRIFGIKDKEKEN